MSSNDFHLSSSPSMPFFGHVSGKTTALLVALATLVHGASTLALPMSMMSKAFQVPPPMRAPAAQELQHRTRFMSLDELFPEAGGRLCEVWDQDSDLRKAVRVAGRADFYKDDPRFDEKRQKTLRAVAKDLGSSLMGTWQRDVPFPLLTKAFTDHGFGDISGDMFISRIAGLCMSDGGKHTFGSWMEIVGRPRGSNHAWHQDSGLLQDTAMLGFPAQNGYVGEGVFSHIIELSHRMPEPEAATPGPVVIEGRFPDEFIIKPVYKKGCEIIIYRDNDVLHSAPDVVCRDALWRFM